MPVSNGGYMRDSEGTRLDERPVYTRPSYDVIVIGATEVGAISAVAAARQGRTVLLVAQNERVGGNVGYAITKMDIIQTVSPMTITGVTREFFSRCARLNSNDRDFNRWYRTGGTVKPSSAKRVFDEMIAAERNITLLRSATLDSVTKTGTTITSATVSGVRYQATVFIDATPTGDVAQKAGCTVSIGREGTTLYGESNAGIFNVSPMSSVDPYVTPGSAASGLLPGVSSRALGAVGAADPGVMTFGWRLFVTSVAGEKLPWPTTPPTGYDAANYELLARQWASNPTYYNATDGTYPSAVYKSFGRSFQIYSISGGDGYDAVATYGDMNSLGYLSSNYPNAEEALEYITATPARRAQIETKALNYLKGLFYFITQSGDSRVPSNLKTAINSYGLSSIELPEYGGWNPNFYVREGARIVGDYVMKFSDISFSAGTTGTVAWWCYDFDGHPVRLVVDSGVLKSEGSISVVATTSQYGTPVSVKVLFPKAAECTNLLCPGQPSVSRYVYLGLRAIPTMMMLGEAAGYVAAEVCRTKVAVQNVNVPRVQAMQGLTMLGKAVAASSGSGDYQVATTVSEGGTGTAFATVTTGIRFGPQVGTAALQSVAAGVVRYKRFQPSIFRPGRYRVVHVYSPTQATDTAGITRASNVQVTISHADGTSTRTHNQRYPGPGVGYDVLGEFYFDYGTPSPHYVDINTNGATTDGLVVVGIVAFIPVDDPTPAING